MAKENGEPTAAGKGKGKAVDEKPSESGKKVEETKKDKDGKPIVNGKNGDEPQEGTWSYGSASYGAITQTHDTTRGTQ